MLVSMSDGGDVRGIESAAVTAWYEAHVPDVKPPLRFGLITGGHSNLTYRVEDAGGRLSVLRRPPLGAVLATAHDMGREHKIISAVSRTDVPVPRPLGLCQDESVNGAPFYVMDFVEGVVLEHPSVAEKRVPEADRMGLGWDVIEVLARLHQVDVDEIGLGDLGRKEGYLTRQLKRWQGQWEKTKTRELPAMDEVHQRLVANMPEQVGAAIVHGDYRPGNLLVGADQRIAAVLDWELCTLGDPLADLGYLLNGWAEPGEAATGGREDSASPTSVPGFPTRRQITERYEQLTGRDASRIDYYRAFQYWRMGAIVEGVLSRYLKGVMGNQADTDAFRRQVDAVAEAALERVRTFGD